MEGAVVKLYVHVVNFLIRAELWYEETGVRCLIYALAKPAELRYDDIVGDIQRCPAEIDHLSAAGAWSEQRDMNIVLRELSQSQRNMESLVIEVRKLCIGKALRLAMEL